MATENLTLTQQRLLKEEEVKDEIAKIKERGEEGIDLDKYDSRWLLAFWSLYRRDFHLIRDSLFPTRNNSTEIRDVIDSLGAYAVARSCVLDAIDEGDDHKVKVYGQHCHLYHADLPKYAQFKKGTQV